MYLTGVTILKKGKDRVRKNNVRNSMLQNARFDSPPTMACRHPNFQKVDNHFIVKNSTVDPPVILSISSIDIEHFIRINNLACTNAQWALNHAALSLQYDIVVKAYNAILGPRCFADTPIARLSSKNAYFTHRRHI